MDKSDIEDANNYIIVDNQRIQTDEQGYLKSYADWSVNVANHIASLEGLELTSEHWLLIEFEQAFYAQFETTPAIRILVKAIKAELGETYGNSAYLHSLFPGGVALQLAKLSGLPRPLKCL